MSSITTQDELHRLIAETFGFPDHYGQNWDAFDECIRDVELPSHIEIAGLEKLRVLLPSEAEMFQHCIADFVKERDHDVTVCPVCGSALDFEPWTGEIASQEICPSCGIQFGYNDSRANLRERTYSQWRKAWIMNDRCAFQGHAWREVSERIRRQVQEESNAS